MTGTCPSSEALEKKNYIFYWTLITLINNTQTCVKIQSEQKKRSVSSRPVLSSLASWLLGKEHDLTENIETDNFSLLVYLQARRFNSGSVRPDYCHYRRPWCPHYTKWIWNRSIILRVRTTVHTIPSQNGAFAKTLFKSEEFKNPGFSFWKRSFLKTVASQ